jgi:hypothetical protein
VPVPHRLTATQAASAARPEVSSSPAAAGVAGAQWAGLPPAEHVVAAARLMEVARAATVAHSWARRAGGLVPTGGLSPDELPRGERSAAVGSDDCPALPRSADDYWAVPTAVDSAPDDSSPDGSPPDDCSALPRSVDDYWAVPTAADSALVDLAQADSSPDGCSALPRSADDCWVALTADGRYEQVARPDDLFQDDCLAPSPVAGCWVLPTAVDSAPADSSPDGCSQAGCRRADSVAQGWAARGLRRGARSPEDSQDGFPADLQADWQAGPLRWQVCLGAPVLRAERPEQDAASASLGDRQAGRDAPAIPAALLRTTAEEEVAYSWQ